MLIVVVVTVVVCWLLVVCCWLSGQILFPDGRIDMISSLDFKKSGVMSNNLDCHHQYPDLSHMHWSEILNHVDFAQHEDQFVSFVVQQSE